MLVYFELIAQTLFMGCKYSLIHIFLVENGTEQLIKIT